MVKFWQLQQTDEIQSSKIIYQWEKGVDLVCFWLETVYLAATLNQPDSYTRVQKASGSRSCRGCAERSGGLRGAWHLLWHVPPPSLGAVGCCCMLAALPWDLGTQSAFCFFDRNCPARKIWNTGDILVSSDASWSGDKYLLLQKKQRQLWVSGSDAFLGDGGAGNGQNSVH